ncbi:SanA/YdcF family protein [Desulfosporosinus hippei]|uniref:Protein SanA, affects membrane permeability for vancomycin n=1 Tax=Desulfosporosinus hippei DSM 8344 TaxID=1121419 RepID=A0A1G7TQY0_9FIRM|nr:ElyC/SanA/YdcF family protein [Desulfosporosinus hippei]SDG36940.1 protein SanA, affects membrane permeability for vancomycin [Desulfosporosinus hippei DSM 8344]
MKKRVKQFLISLVLLILLGGSTALIIDYYVQSVGESYILSTDEVPSADAVLVLGAYVFPSGTVSTMLKDRLTVGYELYGLGKAPKLLVSGDHGQKDYDEVNSMKTFLKDKGVPGQDVFMDHAGFSTYESMYRARDIFGVQKVIIVTQEYHLKRAVFVARALGLEAYGVSSDRHDYGQAMTIYNLREIAARNKDFLWAKVFKPEPTFLGESIPVIGDGKVTDDK